MGRRKNRIPVFSGSAPSPLDALQAAESVQSLDRDQLDGCRRSEAGPHGDESPPETQRPIACRQLGSAVDESRVELLVALVHQRRSDSVEGADRAGHGQPGDHRRAKGRSDVLAFPSGRRGHKALRDVVNAHLGRVQDAGPHDVSADAPVEPPDPVGGVKVTEGLSEAFGFSAVGLGHRLEDVEGVADQRSGASRKGTSGELEIKRSCRLGWQQFGHLFRFFESSARSVQGCDEAEAKTLKVV